MLCPHCRRSVWIGAKQAMECEEPKARQNSYRCPDVYVCEWYERAPGADDELGENQ